MHRRDRTELCAAMGIQECSHRCTYLGHPFCKFKSKNEACKDVMDKLSNKLAGWKQKILSMAGRIVLIKAVAQALPSFIMQTVLLPKGLLHRMDKHIRDFFWGFQDSHSHNLYLKSWSSICLPKVVGGLGIRSMVDINHALLTKLAWNVCVTKDKP